MCEFCTEHGEGKKWYLQMKNYAKELYLEELSADRKKLLEANTRLEWNSRFWEMFVMPAFSTIPKTEDEPASSDEKTPDPPLSDEEIVARRKVIHFGQVIPIEDVERVIDMVDSITRMPCGCRYHTTGLEDQRYCFGFGIDRLGVLGKFPDAASSFEVLEKEKAKTIIREYDDDGQMHSIWTGVTPYVVGICNCDRDCGAYKQYIEMKGPQTFFRAEYLCQVDWDYCNGCKSCISQCQFGAMFYSSALSKVYIDPGRCFGCGVCRAPCAQDAINLLPREDIPEAAGVW
ncbi:MAG: 4Fe-4S ferredoxin [bacterium]|nr:4Fe-4S ferredoxin [bacterium]